MTKLSTLVGVTFFVALLLSACSAEENITQSSTNKTVDDAKNWFETDLNKTNLKILDYVKEIKWNDAIITNGEKGQIIEVPMTLLDLVTTTNKKAKKSNSDDDPKRLNDYHRLLFIKIDDKNYKCFDLQILTNENNFDNLDKNFNYYSIKDDFNGFVTIFDPTKQKINSQEFEDGKRPIHKLTNRMDESAECTYLGWWLDDGSFEPITLLYCTGTGEDYGGGYLGDYGGGGSGGGGYNPTKTTAERIQERIDDTELDNCSKEVLHKLENLTLEGDILHMLERFSPEGSIYDIKMSIGAMKYPRDLAETTRSATSYYVVNMVFNENYIKGIGNSSRPTDLSVATTMAHEIIHGYLISLMGENQACGASGICDFPTIYEAYVQQKITNNPNIVPAEIHKEMAEKYVNEIAKTIQQFDTGTTVDSDYPHQLYLDMAWAGLSETAYFNKIYPDDPTHKNFKDRERILNRFKAEKLGVEYGGQIVKGKPCTK